MDKKSMIYIYILVTGKTKAKKILTNSFITKKRGTPLKNLKMCFPCHMCLIKGFIHYFRQKKEERKTVFTSFPIEEGEEGRKKNVNVHQRIHFHFTAQETRKIPASKKEFTFDRKDTFLSPKMAYNIAYTTMIANTFFF